MVVPWDRWSLWEVNDPLASNCKNTVLPSGLTFYLFRALLQRIISSRSQKTGFWLFAAHSLCSERFTHRTTYSWTCRDMPALGLVLTWLLSQKLSKFLNSLAHPSPLRNCTAWVSHLALASIHGSQIFLKLHSHVKVHNVVPQGGDSADDHVISRVDNLFVWLQ